MVLGNKVFINDLQVNQVDCSSALIQCAGEIMMTSSNGNIFRVTGPLCGELTGPGEFPAQRPVTWSFDVFFDLRLINDWENNREAGDLRRHRGRWRQRNVDVVSC